MTQTKLHFQNAHFITSAPDISAMPEDVGIEIAFAGRSNAGKSSSLNTLTKQRRLAHTSKTPGRTQLINVFDIIPGYRLIDLPGYGFAKVPLTVKKKWQKALGEYLQKRDSLKGLVVLMDIRHPFRDLDNDLIQWAVECHLPVLVLLTKADKLKQSPRAKVHNAMQEKAHAFGGDVQVEVFSSLKGIGLHKLESKLMSWYRPEESESTDEIQEHTE